MKFASALRAGVGSLLVALVACVMAAADEPSKKGLSPKDTEAILKSWEAAQQSVDQTFENARARREETQTDRDKRRAERRAEELSAQREWQTRVAESAQAATQAASAAKDALARLLDPARDEDFDKMSKASSERLDSLRDASAKRWEAAQNAAKSTLQSFIGAMTDDRKENNKSDDNKSGADTMTFIMQLLPILLAL